MSDEYADDLAALYAPSTPPLSQYARQTLIALPPHCSAYELCARLVDEFERDTSEGDMPERYPAETLPPLLPTDLHPLDTLPLDDMLRAFLDDGTQERTGTVMVRVGTPATPRRMIIGISLHRTERGLFARGFDAREMYETQFRYAAESVRLTRLVEALDDGVIFTDGSFRLRFVNDAMLEMGKLRRLGPLPPGSDTRRIITHLDSLVRTGSHHPTSAAELLRRRSHATDMVELTDGRTLRRSYAPLYSGTVFLGNLWVFRDITEERSALLKTQARNRELAELSESRLRFAAASTHELRNPLTTISSFCELLTGDDADPLTEEQRTCLDVIARSTDRTLRLVDDLLLVGRLESGALDLTRTEVFLPEIALTAVAELEPYAEQTGVALHCDVAPGPPLEADRTRIRQAVDNLLGNAVKFTPAGGHVRVRAGYEPGTGHWVLEVRDTGIGIPASFLDSLYEPFQRASNATSARGSGLGLFITRGIVERHGGSLTATSTEGVGSTFTMTLPLRPVSLDKPGDG
ncbi:PAS domain-containing sensor histidine kinase [Streptomyces sp. VRA16 Mangrove soil]|uniref:sensor histidine kinase n=1 Tax=Streptomyces sp. VRA16 Mangrove soil TaxID=2817434 RepID=UPI001A9E7D1B|nr:PAS domain-containing sensor histidine kinase [Streptomyces sp. VRA16 Mangrove soil]MBO1333963.1 hypothetical protein [Streptomyces sp. VRA16 Mangrove soil]